MIGRQTDFLVRADGTIMHALAGIYVLRATEGVAEFKLIQHDLRDVEVLVVPDPSWTPASAHAIERRAAPTSGATTCGSPCAWSTRLRPRPRASTATWSATCRSAANSRGRPPTH